MAKTLNFIITIGDLDIDEKAVISYSMKRNFSDVSSPFEITLIDTPQLWGTDLELSMAAGNRLIQFSYADSDEPGVYQSFEGQIWDYYPTFVGDIKRLTITGYASRQTGVALEGKAQYNIDWNNYYNVRTDENLPWGAFQATTQRIKRLKEYNTKVEESDSRYSYFLNSSLLTINFTDSLVWNSKMVRVRGSGGSIDLPIPDTFTAMIPTTEKTGILGIKKTVKVDEEDADDRFWGPLKKVVEGDSDIEVYREGRNGKGPIRAFTLDGENFYIQLNQNKEYFGAGQLIYNTMGVDISHIVKQLCKLEGWSYNDEDIVQTELVPCSDKYKMQNQTAEEFIMDVLLPNAITPVGVYTSLDGKDKIPVSKGISGFTFYFDKDNKAHFKPLSSLGSISDEGRELMRDVVFGYNVPDTPVLSFQSETKGTAFYTGTAQKMSNIEITTGKQVDTVEVTEEASVLNYNKTKGHHEAIDTFFGYTFEQTKDKYHDNTSAINGWVGLRGATEVGSKSKSFNSSSGESIFATTKIYSSDTVNKGLVTLFPSSGTDSKINQEANLDEVRDRIKKFTTTASMSLWGVADLSPNLVINLTIMTRGADPSDLNVEHPLSGEYLILSQEDVFNGGEYVQKLNLIRSSAVDLKYQNIDWSKKFEAAAEIKTTSKAGGGTGAFGSSGNTTGEKAPVR